MTPNPSIGGGHQELAPCTESEARPQYHPCSMPPYPYSLQDRGQLNLHGYQLLEGQHPCTG